MNAQKVDVLAVMDADAMAASARRSNAVQPANVDHDESNAAWHRSLEARAAVAELIESAANVHAACRAGKEPDLIALADALDGVGAKETRKAALAHIGGVA